ncbi:hypothetical protein AB0K15_29155 [Amycolatopsis sp. NPDC049253]|uniref:hypothetical protein n=1 Tax=Amycolatopsis sp. NPDC049253 TaxID=3155274 RepID=UPI0034250F38
MAWRKGAGVPYEGTGNAPLRRPASLAEHAVHGAVLVPGTALLELVVRAGDEVGCAVVEELTLARRMGRFRTQATGCRTMDPARSKSSRRSATPGPNQLR